MGEYGSDQFVGIVKNGKFLILVPESNCLSVTLTGTREMQAMQPIEMDLTQYEGKALAIKGRKSGNMIWAAQVTEQAGPILTSVIQQVAGQDCILQ